MKRRTDFYIIPSGNIFLLHPVTREAREWADKNIDCRHQTFGNAIVVEHHFIHDLVHGIKADGLRIA
jgi:hypothetical protein